MRAFAIARNSISALISTYDVLAGPEEEGEKELLFPIFTGSPIFPISAVDGAALFIFLARKIKKNES